MCRKLIYLCYFVLVPGLVMTSAARGVDPDLLVWWKFDETSGTTAADSSGNGRDGTLDGNPQWVPGKLNGALEFDGQGDHVIDDDAENYLNGLSALTACMWIKSDSASTDAGFIICEQPDGGDNIITMRYDAAGATSGGTNLLKMAVVAPNDEQQLESSSNLQTTEWQHVCMTWSTGQQLKFYVNGVEDTPQANDGPRSVTTSDVTTLIVGAGGKDDNFGGEGWDGLIDDVRIYSRALTVEEIQQVMVGIPPGVASNPSPADEATDVPRDVVLGWTAGEYAPPVNGHKVYLSENFTDVNDGIGGIAQDANSYAPPQRLDLGTTYYWRVDEVNGAPDYTVYQGDVWSFTTEPVSYPVESITVTASSTHSADMSPENTVNGSGLDDNDLHSVQGTDMWLSSSEPLGAWIQYEFDKAYKLHEMWVWNSNQMIEPLVGFGLKDVTIEYSTNGADYTALGTTHEFAQAPGAAGYAHNTTIDFSGIAAKYVRLTVNSSWGMLPQYGLSEVRFFHIPVRAREPSPQSGATDVAVDVTLGWRAGREAAHHDVYVSTDEQAVIDGTAPVATMTETSYGPLSLDLGMTYYWKINEVNTVETRAMLEGDLWNFTTQEYLVVDDFESYNDLDTSNPESNRIYLAWIDGWEVPTNGSQVGYTEPPFCEETIVHGGPQSMPFFYNNTSGAAYSDAELTLSPPQDWTIGGAKTLSLWFAGDPNNTPGQMYVKVNGSKVTYDGDATNLTVGGWQAWNIELASFATNLQNVTKLGIGIDGSGATGKLFFDDIRLYPYDRQLITPTEPNAAGLMGHWKLDEGAGTIAFDSSSLGNDGAFGGDPQWTAGKIGGAMDFDGDDYVDLGNPSQLDFGTASWSVSAWVKMPTTTENSNIFAKGGDNTGGIRYMLNVSETDDHKACLTVDDNATKVQSTSSVTVDDDRWHHIVGMRDGNTLRLYVDSVQDGAPAVLADGYDLSGTSQANGYIGAGWRYDTSVVHKFLIGVIDDVRIYDYALSDAGIAWLAGRTKPFDKPF